MMKLKLQQFSGGHSVTLYGDAGVTTFTASSSSDVQKDAEVTLTVELATGKEVAEYEIIAGGVTVDPSTKKFTMGESDVVIFLKTKGNNVYKITENTTVIENGLKTALKRNINVVNGKNGEVIGVECEGTALSLGADVIENLIRAGIIIKM